MGFRHYVMETHADALMLWLGFVEVAAPRGWQGAGRIYWSQERDTGGFVAARAGGWDAAWWLSSDTQSRELRSLYGAAKQGDVA